MTKESFDLEVGKRIAAIRDQKHMTQQQVAELAGISIPYYSQIESGIRTMSSYVLARVVEALGTSSDYILFGQIATESDALSRYIGQLTGPEVRTIRSFLELCDQRLCLFEACDHIGSATEEEDGAASAVTIR